MAEPDEGLKNKADSESEDESEVLEESPCGRWQKRREEVTVMSDVFAKYIFNFCNSDGNFHCFTIDKINPHAHTNIYIHTYSHTHII